MKDETREALSRLGQNEGDDFALIFLWEHCKKMIAKEYWRWFDGDKKFDGADVEAFFMIPASANTFNPKLETSARWMKRFINSEFRRIKLRVDRQTVAIH